MVSFDGIEYLIDNAQQFWSELEEIIKPIAHVPTLHELDSTLKRFLDLTVAYHEQYLQSPLQLDHACGLLLDSELFSFHSERMSEILASDVQSNTDPHVQFIYYHILLCHGCRKPEIFKSHKRWRPLIPLLMDHVLVDIDPDIEDTYFGMTPGAGPSTASVTVPIEAKLRTLGVRLLYEVCRVQKLSLQDLRVFDDTFIDALFDLVEQTSQMHDDSFNYSVIKLIVALNEQFMVANLHHEQDNAPESENRVLRILTSRLGSSKTFGENMIFMLNRARRTPEDLCMQLLVLKLLYLLFTTTGTSEYFYTNDLRVLVDVFLRELVDLDEDSESLRHTYLRVLHPLLTKTQLRDYPYKRPQILYALESLMGNSGIRDINPTTKRLVERCLGGEWCVQLRKAHTEAASPTLRMGTSSSDSSADASQTRSQLGIASVHAATHLEKSKTLKSSKSFEYIKNALPSQQQKPLRSPIDSVLRPNNASTLSLNGVATATGPSVVPTPKRKGTANSAHSDGLFADRHHAPSPLVSPVKSEHTFNTRPSPTPASPPISPPHRQRRSAPPPPKRRKPPAIPVGHTNSGGTISAIKSSAIVSP